MKKLVFLFIVFSSFAIVSQAQFKNLVTAKIKTPTVGCESCKTRIEQYFKGVDGVTSVNVNWRTKITTVKFLKDRTNLEFIKTSIANIGYDADDIPANPDAYKLLPKSCKKPEDGGHKN